MKHGVTAVPGALPWLAWLEDDQQEIVASSYHRTRELAESAAPWLPVRDLLRRNADGDLSAADVVSALCEIVEPEDNPCPVGDPDCEGNDGDCHDACESLEAPALRGTDDAHLFRPVHMAPTEGWQRNDTCANCGAPARDHDQATGECPPAYCATCGYYQDRLAEVLSFLAPTIEDHATPKGDTDAEDH